MDNTHVQDHAHAHLNTSQICVPKELGGNLMLNAAYHHTIYQIKDGAIPILSILFLDLSSIFQGFIKSIHTFYSLHSYTKHLMHM